MKTRHLPTHCRSLLACGLSSLLIGACLLPTARAAVTIPGSLATTKGTGQNATLGLFSTSAFTAQNQIAASELAAQGLNVGDSITGVAARLNGGALTGPASSVFYSSIIVTLAEAANSISGMSSTYASNMLNPVEVFNGSYTLPANSMPGGATPNAFDPALAFTTPYTYQDGDLIFMYTKEASSSTLVFDATGPTYTGAGTLYRTVNVATYQPTTGNLSNLLAVHQLQTQFAPEPSRALLLMTGLGALMLRRRRKV